MLARSLTPARRGALLRGPPGLAGYGLRGAGRAGESGADGGGERGSVDQHSSPVISQLPGGAQPRARAEGGVERLGLQAWASRGSPPFVVGRGLPGPSPAFPHRLCPRSPPAPSQAGGEAPAGRDPKGWFLKLYSLQNLFYETWFFSGEWGHGGGWPWPSELMVPTPRLEAKARVGRGVQGRWRIKVWGSSPPRSGRGQGWGGPGGGGWGSEQPPLHLAARSWDRGQEGPICRLLVLPAPLSRLGWRGWGQLSGLGLLRPRWGGGRAGGGVFWFFFFF